MVKPCRTSRTAPSYLPRTVCPKYLRHHAVRICRDSYRLIRIVQVMDLKDFQYSESILIDAPAHHVYDLVTDVTRTGEWSPIVETCWWKEPSDHAEVGAWFIGRNVTPERTWETESLVTEAQRPIAFQWAVNGGVVRWGYTIAPTDTGCELTETWELTQQGLDFFREKYGDDAENQLADRRAAALAGIPATLVRIKEIAETAA